MNSEILFLGDKWGDWEDFGERCKSEENDIRYLWICVNDVEINWKCLWFRK